MKIPAGGHLDSVADRAAATALARITTAPASHAALCGPINIRSTNEKPEGIAMTPAQQSQIRTRMFARTLGPFFAIVPTTVAVRGSYMQTLFTEFKANPMWPWLYGAILLMFGLVMIAFHQYWRSPPAVILSVLGWIMAIRGVLLLTVPHAYSAAGNAVYSSGATAGITVVGICLGAVGLYLTYIGWKPEPRAPTATVSPTTGDHSHAEGD